jgi:MFS family permease
MQHFSVSRNLRALYLIKISKWMNLVMPVVVLFYVNSGMSMQEVFTLKAVYSFTLMFFEIPNGYFADQVGRRISLITGAVLGTAGFLIYSLSSGFYEFVIAEVVLGISLSLVSGADSAMLYDTLSAGGEAKKYTRVEGKITSFGNFAEAIAGILGGLLAIISLRTPFFFQTAIAAIAIPAALSLREPPLVTHLKRISPGGVLRVIRLSLYADKKLSWAIMLSAVIGASTLTMAWFVQPFLIHAGVSVGWFGGIWAFLNAAVGVASYYAWKFEERAGSRFTVILIAAALVISYIGMSVLPMLFGFAMMLVFHLFRGIATPTLRNYINLLTDSNVRATVLSVRNFIIRLLFVLLGPLLGWATDNYSLQTALLMAGLFFGFFSFLSVYFFLKNRSFEP